jgi:hypothetical protein
MKMTFANPNRVAQLSDTAFGVAREPLNTGRDALVEGTGMPYRGKQDLGEGGSSGWGVLLLKRRDFSARVRDGI